MQKLIEMKAESLERTTGNSPCLVMSVSGCEALVYFREYKLQKL